MNIRILLIIFAISIVASCEDQSEKAAKDLANIDEFVGTQPAEEFAANFESYVREGRFPPNCGVSETQTLICDGEILPNPDAPPEDWKSFEFNGRTYYFQPLEIVREDGRE